MPIVKENRYRKRETKEDRAERKEAEKKTREDVKKKKEQRWDNIQIKEKVKAMEKGNYNEIIAFSSGWPWYKVAFNSEMIFEFQILPFIPDAPFKVREDVDGYYPSKPGVVSIKDIVFFAKFMHKAGLEVPEELAKFLTEDGEIREDMKLEEKDKAEIYIFKVPNMTKAKLAEFHNLREQHAEDRDRQAIPFYVPKDLYHSARKLADAVGELVAGLQRNMCQVYGEPMGVSSRLILRDINLTCNGFNYNEGLSYGKALINAIYRSADIVETVRVLEDNRFITPNATSTIMELALNVQSEAKREMERLANPTTGDRIRNEIAKAQGFPSLKDMAKSELPFDIDDGMKWFEGE